MKNGHLSKLHHVWNGRWRRGVACHRTSDTLPGDKRLRRSLAGLSTLALWQPYIMANMLSIWKSRRQVINEARNGKNGSDTGQAEHTYAR